nr:hypothetical protein BaRGS_008046 [Batillaria attramentaria]
MSGGNSRAAQDPAKLRSPLKNESVVGEESLAEDEDGVPEDMEEAPKLASRGIALILIQTELTVSCVKDRPASLRTSPRNERVKSFPTLASEVEGGSRNLRSDTDHVGADTGAVFRVSEECEDLSRTVDGVTITLHNTALWTAFAGIGTEMIINRGGRRMFPFVSISVSGLDPRAVYSIMLEVVPAAPRRYKFVNKAWMAVGVADAAIKNPPYVHPDSPSSGSFWLERRILFSRVKLTNNKDSREGNMLLHSMHKYVVQITIQQLQDSHGNIVDRPYTFRLDETAFIAVTAYQNDMVTQMKIHNNPFAKAFRDAGYSSVNFKNGQARKKPPFPTGMPVDRV